MRVADKMAFDQVTAQVGRNRSDMSELQNQAATQKRVTKPSDDPVASSRVLFGRTEQRSNDQFVKNLNYAKSFLAFTEQSLTELTEVVARAKELALGQASDGSSNAQTKAAIAAEIKQLHDQAVQIGNRKLGERFIFGGYKTTTKPFDVDGNYAGDQGEMKIHIDKETFLAMNLPGDVVFQGRGLTDNGINFKSEKQAMDVDELEAQRQEKAENQDEKQFQAQQRGPASLRVNSELNSAPALAQEEVGAYKTADDGANVFGVLKKLEISLRANDKYGVQESLDRLDAAMNQVILARTSLGSRVMTIDASLESLATMGVDNKANISSLEDADVFQVVSDMNKTESTLQATLQTSGKLMQQSLMDFIR